jgi:hypothetical protein
MCNGWNHSDVCYCGFGGEGHSGGSKGNRVLSHAYDSRSYVDPNASCPVCGSGVFFYQSPNGGRVFFDELGWPWPKHACTDNFLSVPCAKAPIGESRKPAWDCTGWFPFVISSPSTIAGALWRFAGTVPPSGQMYYLNCKKRIFNWDTRWHDYPVFIKLHGSKCYELTTILAKRSSYQGFEPIIFEATS